MVQMLFSRMTSFVQLNHKMSVKRRCLVFPRKKSNDQESIQLPNTFHFKMPKGKKDELKVTAPQSKHYKRKPKGQFPSINGQTAIQNTKFHEDIHSKIYNDSTVQ